MSSKASLPAPDERAPGFVAVCTILAGPNGSGKSSIFELLEPVGEFVNADVIARAERLGDRRAAERTLARLDSLMRERRDFVFETTLSSRHAVTVMRKARAAGYEVGLVFVMLVGVELNVRRVAERVSRGGHDIPENVIRRRHPRSFANLARAIPLAHGCLIYDNSERVPRLLLRVAADDIAENHLDAASAHHVPVAEAVAEALGLEAGRIFDAAERGSSPMP